MTSPYTGSLVLEEITPGRLWRVLEPLAYEVEPRGSGGIITVPARTETDGATIPALLRLVLAVWGTYGRAALIHDFLYGRLAAGDPHPLAPTRAAADRIFRQAMAPLGTPLWLRWLIWAAVRIGGRPSAARSA